MRTKFNYTSGPWRVCPTDETCIEYNWDDKAETAKVIGFIDDAYDAKLIAAAPEMLCLLLHLCSEIGAEEREAILFEARGVIAKATGGAE